ncbi:MAG TPA: sulfotransferase [Acidimicrobiales bacterium]|nr:sulfotransferase [Acidimicrobiales bacterium]
MADQTRAAFRDLLDELGALHGRLADQLDGPGDELTALEAHRWILSILQVASDVYIWSDTGRPRFVDIVGPYKKWGGDNADAFYCFTPIDPARTYKVAVDIGDAVYLSLTVYGGPDDGRYSDRIVGSLNSREAPPSDSGRIEMTLSAQDPGDGSPWIRLAPDAVCALTRDYLEDPNHGRRAVWHIEAVDPPAHPVATDADLARRIRATTTWIQEQAKMVPLPLGAPNTIDPPYPVPQQTYGWAAGDAAYAMGSFELNPDQALVIRGRSPGCAFWNMCLWNPFLHTYNYDYERVTINGAQVRYGDDGSWEIVVAAHDPGHPNWVSTGGHRSGRIWFRWFLPDGTPEHPSVEVISNRPAAVTIEDLEDPVFSDEVSAVFGFMADAGAALELRPEPLMAGAVEQTGLDDFGALGFVERLDVLCRGLRDEAGLSPAGAMAQHALLTGLLRNRLLIEDRNHRHPEILAVEVRAPIIICGLPRTGTTHLHNLMSADPALRSLPYWESLEPVLAESERPAAGEPDPRRARTERALWLVNSAMPHFVRMHEMTVDHAHEEIQLLAIDFSSMLFETIAPMPSWRDYYLAHDQRASYEYMKRVLQVMQWERGGDRWVLKSPQHLEQFPVLARTFPDATFVVPHRDPVSVTASMTMMLAYSARMGRQHVDVAALGRYWSDRLERMLRSCVDDRDSLPADRSIDVRFDEFMADDVAMVARIYEIAGQPFPEASKSAMEAFMVQHPRGRFGTVHYDLHTFGLDWAERRRALGFYSERFGLADEPAR